MSVLDSLVTATGAVVIGGVAYKMADKFFDEDDGKTYFDDEKPRKRKTTSKKKKTTSKKKKTSRRKSNTMGDVFNGL